MQNGLHREAECGSVEAESHLKRLTLSFDVTIRAHASIHYDADIPFTCEVPQYSRLLYETRLVIYNRCHEDDSNCPSGHLLTGSINLYDDDPDTGMRDSVKELKVLWYSWMTVSCGCCLARSTHIRRFYALSKASERGLPLTWFPKLMGAYPLECLPTMCSHLASSFVQLYKEEEPPPQPDSEKSDLACDTFCASTYVFRRWI